MSCYNAGVLTAPPTAPILIVEDDPQVRELYRSLLRQAGFSVIAVEDGLSALHCIEERRPAAVVLDLVLPRLSGRDVYQELRTRPDTRNIPIVVVSGHDVSDLTESDFACVLRKPLDLDTLVEAVRSSIARAQRSPEAT